MSKEAQNIHKHSYRLTNQLAVMSGRLLPFTNHTQRHNVDQGILYFLLSTAEEVVTAGVVCGVCSFTAGLLLGVLLTQCHGHCHRKGKRGQTEIPPVYEDIPLEKTPAIELTQTCLVCTQSIPKTEKQSQTIARVAHRGSSKVHLFGVMCP